MMNAFLLKLRISRRLPQSDIDGGREGEPARGNRYGEQFAALSVPSLHNLADDGIFFTTSNPAPGTALAAPVAASFSDTAALFHILNTADQNDPASKSIYLAHLKHAFTVAPASATGMRYLVRLDKGPRTPSAGQTILAGQGGSPGASPVGPMVAQSIAKIWSFTGAAQMTVAGVSTEGRTVAIGGFDGIPVVGGERTIIFGSMDAPSSGQVSRANPVVIPPGWAATIHEWFPSNATTGASLEPELAWWER
jgi:hypothetical protein